MANAAVAVLMENLTQLLKISHTVHLISDKARKELEQLKDELRLLENVTVERRIITELVYDVEDTIDSCLPQTAKPKGKNIFWRNLNRNYLSLAKKIKSLREDRLKPIIDNVSRASADMATGDGSRHNVEEPNWIKSGKAPTIRKDHIVGFEDETKTIIHYLNEETKKLDVISIIGMPGLGKTTLAGKIFRHPQIQNRFPTRIWVEVSPEFSTSDVFLNILKVFTSQGMSSLSKTELATRVRDYLENATFLLLLDDVWTIEAWNSISTVLPTANCKSKVLITSRNMEVGRYANINREPFALRFLDDDESWELLQLEVFGNLHNCPPELEEIGRRIAKQCYGLPYAVITMAGLLVEKFSRSRGIEGIKQVWYSWMDASSGMDFSKDLGEYVGSGVTSTLTASYETLPEDLRNCFLYLGVFPKDYEIPVSTLTRLWIAEGFIQHREGQSLEETAEENLKFLIKKNLVMVVKEYVHGEVKTCRVHDIIREFCISEASLMKEQNLFQEIKRSIEGIFEPSVSDIQHCRRLCIHYNLSDFASKFISERIKKKRVRSFLCYHKEPFVLPPEYVSAIFGAFNLLRVMDSKSIILNQFPRNITKLIHLRYLTLSFDDLKVLPKEVSELWNLQTLVVETKSHTLEIKGSLWKMAHLRHLKTKSAITLAVQGDSTKAAENLQTLSRLSPESCTANVFRRIPNIKKLGIHGRLFLLDNNSLKELGDLENLKLVNDFSSESATDHQNLLPSLPPLNCFPPSIKRLTLSAMFLDWSYMSILGKIYTLEVLKLKYNAFTGKTWRVVPGGFRRLKFLLIESTNLARIAASPDHFPNLSCLVLKNCKNLSQIPPDLTNNVHTLDTGSVPKSLPVNAAKEGWRPQWAILSCV